VTTSNETNKSLRFATRVIPAFCEADSHMEVIDTAKGNRFVFISDTDKEAIDKCYALNHQYLNAGDLTFDFISMVSESAIYDKGVASSTPDPQLFSACRIAGKYGPFYSTLGLAGESGEICNKLKKVWRGDRPLDDALKIDLLDELGDVLWYVQDIASRLGSNIVELMAMNTQKIKGRMERGTIRGNGDKR